jgi:CRISPR/Cas system CSM-associated protein Csm3 (group 7 of RAMP superfamily)
MSTLTLKFDIRSYWHVGSGEDGGAYADSLMLKNSHGLPYLPGRAVKGLLRSAFALAEENHWFEALKKNGNLTQYVFGGEGETLEHQGMLVIDSAELSWQEQEHFQNNPTHTSALFDVHYSTAIDENTGSAKKHSLRSMEVAVPMTLSASISIEAKQVRSDDANEISVDQVSKWLVQVAPLITSLGAKRSRGYGEVWVTVE